MPGTMLRVFDTWPREIDTVTTTDEEPEIKLPSVTWQVSDRTGI